jgi:hypothetical protein
MTTLTPTGHPLADAITALEAVAASACDPEHTIDDLAGLLRADVLGQALLVHVKWRRPVDTPHGRLIRAWTGRKDVWNHRATADAVIARVAGADPSNDVRRVVAAVLDLAQINGWRKGLLRDQLDIEPNEEPGKPKDGVTYLGLCEQQAGRETVRFETTKPPTAPTEPAGAEQ